MVPCRHLTLPSQLWGSLCLIHPVFWPGLLQHCVRTWRGTRGAFLDLRLPLLNEESQAETEHVIAKPQWDLTSSNWSIPT